MSAGGSDDSIAPENATESPAALTAGDKVVYPGHGPCGIGRLVKRVVDGRSMTFYHLTVLDETGGDLFVPVEKACATGLRSLIKVSEIPQLVAHLKTSARAADTWKERATDNMKLLATGSPFDLAEIVASLTELGDRRSLTLGESATLGRAKRLLVCEISEVTGEAKTTAEELVDEALKARVR
jgi:CarD family transcriptional regulator, regulator of rRNA transcription